MKQVIDHPSGKSKLNPNILITLQPDNKIHKIIPLASLEVAQLKTDRIIDQIWNIVKIKNLAADQISGQRFADEPIKFTENE